MYHGSLATVGPWEALVTFQQFLILADRLGMVDMTAEVIARISTVPIEIITKGISVLEQPDPQSRNAQDEGRRIKRLSDERTWGWQIVNHAHYRAIRSAEERRDYMREKMREHRAKKGASPHQPDTGNVIERIPIIGGKEFEVRESFVAELTRLYPAVDIPATLRQMRGWCIGNPTKLKTPRGIRKFITGWCERDQNG